eukprot:GHVH01007802.1.p1 GENE.GHVH01007802.1~~GHVH01007802.1.p1  ORF type:complete len:201 (+),score=30.08 GHVH01007802.1:577-1179(+)
MSTAAEPDEQCKILLIGDSGSGKSCILLRFSDGKFTEKRLCTIGIDFKVKVMDIDGKRVKLQIWDTAGQERFKTITQAYYRSAMGILVVYDVNNPTSFKNARNWLEQIEQQAPANIIRILVGNKNDLDTEVASAEVQQLANEYKIPYYETSAKTGHNIEFVFTDLANRILKTRETHKSTSSGNNTVDIKKQKKTPNNCCM